MKTSVWIVALAVVALLATAGLISVGYYFGNPSEPPEQLGGMPEDPVMAKELGSGDFEIDAVPLEELRDGNRGTSRIPSNPEGTDTRYDGDRTMRGASQDELVTLDNISEAAEDYAMPGLGLDETGGAALVEDKALGLFPDTGEASIPTPEPASSGRPAEDCQAGLGTGVSVSPAFTPTPKAPVDEVGETATQLEGKREALKPGPGGEGNDADDQALLIPEKRVLKYPNLGSMLDQLVARVETGEATAEEAAADAPLHQGTSVAVTIYLSNNVEGLVSFLENKGGSPRNVGEDYIEAYVPVTLLGQASEQAGVLRVRAITPPQPARTGPALRAETLPAQDPLNDKVELTDFCDQD